MAAAVSATNNRFSTNRSTKPLFELVKSMGPIALHVRQFSALAFVFSLTHKIWAAAEGGGLETFPVERVGEFYEDQVSEVSA